MIVLKMLADAFHEGGWGMWPILFLLMITISIVIERAVFLRKGRACWIGDVIAAVLGSPAVGLGDGGRGRAARARRAAAVPVSQGQDLGGPDSADGLGRVHRDRRERRGVPGCPGAQVGELAVEHVAGAGRRVAVAVTRDALERHRRAGEERKSHELVAQHQDLAAIARPRRASTNSPNDRLVIQKPAGRGEK